MKKLIISFLTAVFLLVVVPSAFAAPTNPNKAKNNPNVVAHYEDGIHAIAADPVFWVEGSDLVMKRGNSGNFQQWFTEADGHGIHSVWNISKNGKCSSGWVLIEQAYPNWGDYLVPGADYCVHNNEF